MGVSPLLERARVARRFHEEYEALAKSYGWTTQEASARPWDEVPPNQRALMVHVIGNLEAEGVITIPGGAASDRVRGGTAMDILSIAVEAAAAFTGEYIGFGQATLDIAIDGTGATMSSGVASDVPTRYPAVLDEEPW